jgi:hypothetical protein
MLDNFNGRDGGAAVQCGPLGHPDSAGVAAAPLRAKYIGAPKLSDRKRQLRAALATTMADCLAHWHCSQRDFAACAEVTQDVAAGALKEERPLNVESIGLLPERQCLEAWDAVRDVFREFHRASRVGHGVEGSGRRGRR